MALNVQNIFMVLILCIIIVFISGILLPKYLSHQYFQLRQELNNDSDSKYRSWDNLTSVSEGTPNERGSTLISDVAHEFKETNTHSLEQEILAVTPLKLSRQRRSMFKIRKSKALAKKHQVKSL